MGVIEDRSEIERLAGGHANVVKQLSYFEKDGIRTYHVQVKDPDIGSVRAFVRIEPMAFCQEKPVKVTITGPGRHHNEIGSFTLSPDQFPSPVSFDPEVGRRSIEILLAYLRRRRDRTLRPEA